MLIHFMDKSTDASDSIYAQHQDKIAAFVFDDSVADVFPDMIQRSVPGYPTTLAMIGVLAEQFAQPDSHCYDLGCSLGASTLSMAQRIKHTSCKVIGIDNSEAMVERCRANILKGQSTVPVEIICADIVDTPIEKASVVVLNFTLQFIDPAQRAALVARIYERMLPGGVLILSEKLKFEDSHTQELNTHLYHSFKRANGYSELEVSQKRTALENVLIPETYEAHEARLKQAGFQSVDLWFRCFNFASIIAHKEGGAVSS